MLLVPPPTFNGAVAQLGERSVRNAEVEGSSPFCSTMGHTFTLTFCTACWVWGKRDPLGL